MVFRGLPRACWEFFCLVSNLRGLEPRTPRVRVHLSSEERSRWTVALQPSLRDCGTSCLANYWQYSLRLSAWMNEAIHLTIKFLVVILWMMRVVAFDELRLSIILAPEEENDYYFDFLQSFSHAAAVGGESKLSFEIIVVQTSRQITDYKGSHTPYSQSDAWHEMPAAASLPITKEFASVTWRFITVDRQQYAVTKGSLWETSARNIGAVRARGKFLLFPRPDAMVPDGIVQWLVEHTFDDRAVIYAAACNQDLTADHNRCVSSNATTCTISRKVRALPSTDKARSLHDMRAFTLFPRELFMSARGYLEAPTTLALPPQPALQTSQIPRPSTRLATAPRILQSSICHTHRALGGGIRAASRLAAARCGALASSQRACLVLKLAAQQRQKQTDKSSTGVCTAVECGWQACRRDPREVSQFCLV